MPDNIIQLTYKINNVSASKPALRQVDFNDISSATSPVQQNETDVLNSKSPIQSSHTNVILSCFINIVSLRQLTSVH